MATFDVCRLIHDGEPRMPELMRPAHTVQRAAGEAVEFLKAISWSIREFRRAGFAISATHCGMRTSGSCMSEYGRL
jgi:hypothetical protein